MKTKTTLADRRAALSQNSEKYKQAIGSQVNDLKANAGRIGKNALVIGGTLLAGYLLVRLLVGKQKPPKATGKSLLPVAPVRRELSLVSLIRQQMALFVLKILTDKLQALLEARSKR